MIGLIARADDSGLGNQTYDIARTIRPDKILLIDFESFAKLPTHPERYDGFNVQLVKNFISNSAMVPFLKGLTSLMTCETFYNNKIVNICRRRGIRTANQYNYEFFEGFSPNYIRPDILFSPSRWHFSEMSAKWGAIHLPPPIVLSDFKEAREYNLEQKHGRLLHIMGRPAVEDRNGTISILRAMQSVKADVHLVLKVQTELPPEIARLLDVMQDSRITVDVGSVERGDMYKGYDALIFPRRYGGLCMPMNEALASGLPVIMTDMQPNNYVLPKQWLVPATKRSILQTRTPIEVFNASTSLLASRISTLANMSHEDLQKHKLDAFELAIEHFSHEKLKAEYLKWLL